MKHKQITHQAWDDAVKCLEEHYGEFLPVGWVDDMTKRNTYRNESEATNG